MLTKEQLESFSKSFGSDRDAAREKAKSNMALEEEKKKRRKYLDERDKTAPAKTDKGIFGF